MEWDGNLHSKSYDHRISSRFLYLVLSFFFLSLGSIIPNCNHVLPAMLSFKIYRAAGSGPDAISCNEFFCLFCATDWNHTLSGFLSTITMRFFCFPVKNFIVEVPCLETRQTSVKIRHCCNTPVRKKHQKKRLNSYHFRTQAPIWK